VNGNHKDIRIQGSIWGDELKIELDKCAFRLHKGVDYITRRIIAKCCETSALVNICRRFGTKGSYGKQ